MKRSPVGYTNSSAQMQQSTDSTLRRSTRISQNNYKNMNEQTMADHMPADTQSDVLINFVPNHENNVSTDHVVQSPTNEPPVTPLNDSLSTSACLEDAMSTEVDIVEDSNPPIHASTIGTDMVLLGSTFTSSQPLNDQSIVDQVWNQFNESIASFQSLAKFCQLFQLNTIWCSPDDLNSRDSFVFTFYEKFVHLGCTHGFSLLMNKDNPNLSKQQQELRNGHKLLRCPHFKTMTIESLKHLIFQQIISPIQKSNTKPVAIRSIKRKALDIKICLKKLHPFMLQVDAILFFKDLFRECTEVEDKSFNSMINFKLNALYFPNIKHLNDVKSLTSVLDREYYLDINLATFVFLDKVGVTPKTLKDVIKKGTITCPFIKSYSNKSKNLSIFIIVMEVPCIDSENKPISQEVGNKQINQTLQLIQRITRLTPLSAVDAITIVDLNSPEWFSNNKDLQKIHSTLLSNFNDGKNGVQYELARVITFQELDYIYNKVFYFYVIKYNTNYSKLRQKIINKLVELDNPECCNIPQSKTAPVPPTILLKPVKIMLNITAINIQSDDWSHHNIYTTYVSTTTSIADLLKRDIPSDYQIVGILSCTTTVNNQVMNHDLNDHVHAIIHRGPITIEFEYESQRYKYINLEKKTCKPIKNDSTKQINHLRKITNSASSSQSTFNNESLVQIHTGDGTIFSYLQLPTTLETIINHLQSHNNLFIDLTRSYITSHHRPLHLDSVITLDSRILKINHRLFGGFEPAMAPADNHPNIQFSGDEQSSSTINNDAPDQISEYTSEDVLLHTNEYYQNTVTSIPGVTYNGRGGRNGLLREDIIKIIDKHHPLWIHICEYRVNNDIHIPNYRRINLNHDPHKESDRQCVFIHSSIEDITTLTPSQHYAHTIKILGVLYTFVYIPPNIQDRLIIYQELDFGFTRKAIMTGDFNSRLPSLQDGHNRQGRQFESYFVDKCYQCHNPPNKTTKSNSNNILDLLLSHQSTTSSITSFSILDDLNTTSDHYPIMFTVNLPSAFLIPRKLRFNTLGTNDFITTRYQQHLDRFIHYHDYTSYSTSEKWQLLHNSILSSGEITVGMIDSFSTPQSLFTTKMHYLQRNRDNVRKKLSKNQSSTNRRRLKSKVNQINNQIKKEHYQIQRDNFNEYLNKLIESPNNVYYELCRIKNKSKRSSTAVKCDLVDTKDYYTNHFHAHVSDWQPISYCVSKEQHDTATRLFSFDNVKHSVQTINAHKASGDSIPAKALKYLSDDAITLLQSIFIQSYLESTVPRQWQNSSIVEVFKSGLFIPERFRPICLISAAFKLYQQFIYYSHLRELLTAGHRQHGYQPRRSCSTQLQQVLTKIKELNSDYEEIFGLAMDLSQAFDCMRHETIAHYVDDKLNPHDINVLRNIVAEQRFYFRRDPSKETFNFGRGTPQGGTISGVIFAFVLDKITEEFDGPFDWLFIYADDILILAHSLLHLQSLSTRITRRLREFGFKPNVNKFQ